MNANKHRSLVSKSLHWAILLLITLAFLTAYPAFDFTLRMPVSVRDALFAIHRLSGLTASILLLIWGMIAALQWFSVKGRRRHLSAVGAFHIGLSLIGLIVPVLPWIGRSQEGRVSELYSILPVFNSVSHPTALLTYELLHWHKLLANYLLAFIALHACGALFHWLILKDGRVKAMLFW